VLSNCCKVTAVVFGKLLLIRLVKPSRVAVQFSSIVDVQGGTCLKTFQGRTNGVRSVSFSPMAHTGGSHALLRLWDWQQETCSKALPGHTSWIWAVAFHQWVKWLQVAAVIKPCSSGCARWYLLPNIAGTYEFGLLAQFQPNGHCSSGSSDQTVRLWDVQDGSCLTRTYGWGLGSRV